MSANRDQWIEIAGKDLALDAVSVFPQDDGFFVKRRALKTAKLIQSLRPVLLGALEQGETVKYVCRGVFYDAAEFYFTGYVAAQLSNMYGLVLTDRRLLLVNIDRKGRPLDIKNQIPIGEIRGAKKSGIFGGYTELRTADGKKMLFMAVPAPDRKELIGRIGPIPKGKQEKSPVKSLQHLCPGCLSVIPGRAGDVEVCPHEACRIPLRSAKLAAKMSALVPGVGDLYLRHFFFGTMEFLGSMFALGIGIYFIAYGFVTGDVAVGLTIGLLVIGLSHIIDYFLTLHMGRKGFVPLALRPVPTGPRWAMASNPGTPANLPKFPGWTYAMFAVTGVLFLFSMSAMVPELTKDSKQTEVVEMARAGKFDEAMQRWVELKAADAVSDDGRGRAALAFYEAGDWESGQMLIDELGGRSIDESLANTVNALIERRNKSQQDYEQGTGMILAGNEAGWDYVDQALGVWRTVKRPTLPQTRDEVKIELAKAAPAPEAAPSPPSAGSPKKSKKKKR